MAELNQELEKFSEEVQNFLLTSEKNVVDALGEIETRCLNNSRDDVDRYAECMTRSLKKVSKEEERFQYRVGFLQHKLHDCLTQNEQTKNYDVCKTDAKANLEKYINDLVKNIKN